MPTRGSKGINSNSASLKNLLSGVKSDSYLDTFWDILRVIRFNNFMRKDLDFWECFSEDKAWIVKIVVISRTACYITAMYEDEIMASACLYIETSQASAGTVWRCDTLTIVNSVKVDSEWTVQFFNRLFLTMNERIAFSDMKWFRAELDERNNVPIGIVIFEGKNALLYLEKGDEAQLKVES